MKAAESKTTATAQHLQAKAETQEPFFQKERTDSVLEQGNTTFFSPQAQSQPFFSKPTIQTKLSIGQPGDKYEQEADQMADQVVQRLAENESNPVTLNDYGSVGAKIQRKPIFESNAEPSIQAKFQNSTTPQIQTKCAECEQEEKLQQKEETGLEEQVEMKTIIESNAEPSETPLQPKLEHTPFLQKQCAECAAEEETPGLQKQADSTASTAATPSLESRLSSSRGGGSPLPEHTRTQMEGAFGSDFSGVRIHTDSAAVQMNKELGAQAFTHGSDVYFNAGKYDAGSREGQRLLGHELTHVVQQGEGRKVTLQRECNPSISSCPPSRSSLTPTTQQGTSTTQTTPVLARIQPLQESDRTTLQRAFGGAPLLNYINQRDIKRREVEEKNNELLRIRPEHGIPEPGGELEQRINWLRIEIENLTNEILRLDNLVHAGLEALGLTEESQLITLVNETFPALFIRRGREIAIAELNANKQIVEEEAQRYGLGVCVDPTARRGLIRAAQDLVQRRQRIEGYRISINEARRRAPIAGTPDPESMGSSYYDYVRINEYEERIRQEEQQLTQVRQRYGLSYPVLFRQNLNLEFIAYGDEATVNQIINGELTQIINNIEATKQNIEQDRLKVWNLRNIVQMTAADLGADENPDLMASINRHIQEAVSAEETLQLALTALAITASIIATVATAGGYAVVAGAAAGVGLGISIGEATNAVQQYLAESRAENTALDPAIADISARDPDLTWVVMSIVGVALDILQVRAVFSAVRSTARALRTSEDVGRLGQLARGAGASAVAAERLMSAGSNQLLKIGLRETASQVGTALAFQALANEILSDDPNTEMSVEGWQVDIPAQQRENIHIQRSIEIGRAFEDQAAGMVRRGTIGLPEMDHVIRLQYNGSGHGIDFIGIREDEAGRIFVYRFEAKGHSTAAFPPTLDRRSRGMQTGREWTLHAIQQAMENPRLRGLIETRMGYNLGESLTNSAVRTQILRRLRNAQSFVIVRRGMNVVRLAAQMGGMGSRGSSYRPRRILRVP